MFRFPGDYRRLFFLRREAAFFPYYFSSRERALIIGPGGGVRRGRCALRKPDDRLAADRSCRDQPGDRRASSLHTESTTAICTTWRGWSCTVGDGRNYLERSRARYDLIALPLVYAEAAMIWWGTRSPRTTCSPARRLPPISITSPRAASTGSRRPQSRADVARGRHLGCLVGRARPRAERGARPSVVVNGARGEARARQWRQRRPEAEHRPLLLVQRQPYTAGQLARLHAAMEELGLVRTFHPEGANDLRWRRCAGLHWRTLSPPPNSTSRRRLTTGPMSNLK